jgi:hypothetical protein
LAAEIGAAVTTADGCGADMGGMGVSVRAGVQAAKTIVIMMAKMVFIGFRCEGAAQRWHAPWSGPAGAALFRHYNLAYTTACHSCFYLSRDFSKRNN